MTRFFALVAVACLAAGCADEADRATSTAPATTAAGTAPCATSAYAPLPPGIEVGHDFFVRNDRMVGKDRNRRRVVLELRSGDAEAVVASMVQALVAQGARQTQGPDGDAAAVRYVLAMPRMGRIVLSASDSLGSRPSHPDSTGVVLVEWPTGMARAADGADVPADSMDDGKDAAEPTDGLHGTDGMDDAEAAAGQR
jgi:hypothetical protein